MEGLSAGLTFSDRFTLVRRLGVGGMGEIWLADDRELSDRIALKLLDERFSASPDRVDLLRQECSRARSLVHPNIVRIFDFHSAEHRYFISMQYIDGDTLLASRGGSFQKIVHQVLMVCDALAYAHRANVIHRDIKPSNVLVDRNGVCFLSDFGLAVGLPPGGAAFDSAQGGGTLPSMSPQQLAGQPATVSDDIYSLGALLYELLAGAPLFHPDVTAARIRDERPAPLGIDQSGQPIPDSLTKLVAAMLSKSPEQRPAGVGAVRSVLEEVATDYPVGEDSGATDSEIIRPISRKPGAASTVPGRSAPPLRRIKDERKGTSPLFVYGGLGALLLVALVVIFLLPDAVRERRAAEEPEVEDAGSQAVPDAAEAGPAEPSSAALAVMREIADERLGELLVAEDGLRAVGVEVWGGGDWAEAQRISAVGDEAYQDRQYETAADQYRQALAAMNLLEPRATEVLATALAEGTAALEAGQHVVATERFELALAIDPVNAVARAGIERAARLDEVLELMRAAAELEESGDLAAAAQKYEQALAIDPQWTAAREGLTRSRGEIAQIGYETRMAAGFGALSRNEFERARSEFEAALAARPGDPDATVALQQVDVESRQVDVIRLQAQARIAEVGENWSSAVSHYEAILGIDPAVVSARQNLARAAARQRLDDGLDVTIGKADQLNDERVARSARGLLEEARAVDSPGPVLEAQIVELGELLRVAAIPVPVNFQSDNLTEVVIYKVGSLGTFQARTLDLKPGSYVAVGSREGYRDVRRSFRVFPQGTEAPIVLSCEEPI